MADQDAHLVEHFDEDNDDDDDYKVDFGDGGYIIHVDCNDGFYFRWPIRMLSWLSILMMRMMMMLILMMVAIYGHIIL